MARTTGPVSKKRSASSSIDADSDDGAEGPEVPEDREEPEPDWKRFTPYSYRAGFVGVMINAAIELGMKPPPFLTTSFSYLVSSHQLPVHFCVPFTLPSKGMKTQTKFLLSSIQCRSVISMISSVPLVISTSLVGVPIRVNIPGL